MSTGSDPQPFGVAAYQWPESAQGVLQSILGSSKDCIKILDLEGNLLYLNESGRAELGIDDINSILGSCWIDFWKGSDRQAAEEAIAAARAGKTGSFEGYFATLKGEPRWWDVAVTPIIGADGRPHNLLSISRDITERKRTEQRLRASEETFRSLADEMDQICLSCDGAGKLVWMNRRWTEYTGLNLEEAHSPAWQKAHSPETVGSLVHFFEQAFKKGEPFDRIHQIRSREGKFAWFLVRGTPVRSATGELLRWFVTATNVDAIMHGDEEQKRLLKNLQRLNAELQDFAHLLSHDLQTYVRTILTFSQMLARRTDGRLDQDENEYLAGIKQGAWQMYDLIRTVLNYSTLHSKPLLQKATDLYDLVQTTLLAFRPLLEENEAGVDVAPLPMVWADPVLLRQLFQNLIVNSIKYRKPGILPRIRISATEKQKDAVICVSDNGPGIDPKDHERIFAPLQRLHDDTVPGTGFGLTLCRRIVERHGGRIWVESEVGAGATFCFTLPLASANDAGRADDRIESSGATEPLQSRPAVSGRSS